METRWTVQELVDLSGRFLCEEGDSRRIRWNPTPRLIRYYTTLGLLDRPFGVRGHTVYYGPRHLLQLLAIKALQLEGLSLHLIQERLQGLPDKALLKFSGLTEDWLETSPVQEREDFWKIHPQNDTVELAPGELPLQGIQLAPGVTLLIDRHQHTHINVARLLAAAAPLLAVLQKQEEETR